MNEGVEFAEEEGRPVGQFLCRIVIQDGVEFPCEIRLHMLEKIVDVFVMEIEGAAVDVRHLGDLPDGDVLDLFFFHETDQTVPERALCLSHAAVFMGFVFHKCSSPVI